jgi:uncharacterized protein
VPIDRDLVNRLEEVARDRCRESAPAHDFLHVLRVASTGLRIADQEGADPTIVVGAALLHEIFNYPKGHPQTHLSGEIASRHAGDLLDKLHVDRSLAEPICYAIRVHGFSRGIVPETLEAKILQDADRLDAIGAIGIARCFATCSQMERPFYSVADPFCRSREPDDKNFGLDHFYRKLLILSRGLHTAAARELASRRVAFMETFLRELENEIDHGPFDG